MNTQSPQDLEYFPDFRHLATGDSIIRTAATIETQILSKLKSARYISFLKQCLPAAGEK
jgi:hypothetical protein